MSNVSARPPRGKSIDVDDFTDLTGVAAERVEWGENGELIVTFPATLPPAVAAAVRRRIVSRNHAEEVLRAESDTYLNDAEPDLTEIRAQVERLTQLVLGGSSEGDA